MQPRSALRPFASARLDRALRSSLLSCALLSGCGQRFQPASTVQGPPATCTPAPVASATPASDEPTGPIRHVIIVTIDGLLPESYLHPEAHGLQIPNLRRLLSSGAYSTGADSVFPSLTYPS